MKQNFMPSLVLVLGVFSALARKPSDQQGLSAVPDDGFSAANIEQIESSILSLAKEQGSTADPNTQEAINDMFVFIWPLLRDVYDRAIAEQGEVNQSYQNLLNCKLNLTLDPRSNLTVLSTRHKECSAEESTLAASVVTCTNNCAARCATAQASCSLYCPVNIPQPMPGAPVPNPTPSPTSCWYDTKQVKTDNEAGLYHEWEANKYYKKWEDNFQTLYDDWKTKLDGCKARVSEMNSCYNTCTSAQGTGYAAKKQECTEHQYDLEAAACPGDSLSCQGYLVCHASLTDIYLKDVASANESQQAWTSQYKGIQRVICLLQAFNSSLSSGGTSLSAGIAACQARTYEPCTEQPSLCLHLRPAPPPEECNMTTVTGTNTSFVQPGSDEWIAAYYSNMPNKTSYEECGAKCCVPGANKSTTTTTTTPLVQPSNCSLCCNTTDSWCVRAGAR